jgi:hypothetical protein
MRALRALIIDDIWEAAGREGISIVAFLEGLRRGREKIGLRFVEQHFKYNKYWIKLGVVRSVSEEFKEEAIEASS